MLYIKLKSFVVVYVNIYGLGNWLENEVWMNIF